MPILYSFFSPVPELSLVDETKLILLWKESWTAAGFEPVVLNEHIAGQHPFFEEYNQAISKLPTINPPLYEKYCYLRWLAVAQAGKDQDWCLMSDYDLMPIPTKIKELQAQLLLKRDKLTVFQTKNVCPSLVGGRPEHFFEMVEYFSKYQLRPEDNQNGVVHTSDQYVLENKAITEPESVGLVNMVRLYGEQTPDTCALHFANSCMTPNGLQPRWQHIPKILSELVPV